MSKDYLLEEKPVSLEERADTDVLTVHDVARYLRVDDTTVRRWIKSGVLAAFTLPHVGNRQSYRVYVKTLRDLMSAQSQSIAV